jgi:hypothetical protein
MADEITSENAEVCANCGRMRKKGSDAPYSACFLPFANGHHWRPLGESDPWRLNMNGSALTVTALAWIANALEKHGQVRVTNCATANLPGIAAMHLGAALCRAGFLEANPDAERLEAHEQNERAEG